MSSDTFSALAIDEACRDVLASCREADRICESAESRRERRACDRQRTKCDRDARRDCAAADGPVPDGPTCDDGTQNGDEAGVDCGGSCGACPSITSCDDGVQNGDETGVDCGGSCGACPSITSCDDGVQNGDETGVDCGGRCEACEPTATGSLVRSGEMLITRAHLMSLPTSGASWDRLVRRVDESWGPVDLANQDSKTSAYALGAALIYARTGDARQRDRVIEVLRQVASSPLDRVLGLARGLPGYVLAADLVGYREPAFLMFLDDIRTRDIGGHGRWTVITDTSEDSASNWGTWAAAARVAASVYLGDRPDVARAERIFRRWLGDTSIDHSFRPTSSFDASWVCGPLDQAAGVNPASCGSVLDGALVEDISRGEPYPSATNPGLAYSQNALRAQMLQAVMLERAGYDGLFSASGSALRRAGDFLERNNAWSDASYSTSQIPAQLLNHYYGARYATGTLYSRAILGNSLGYIDWLFP